MPKNRYRSIKKAVKTGKKTIIPTNDIPNRGIALSRITLKPKPKQAASRRRIDSSRIPNIMVRINTITDVKRILNKGIDITKRACPQNVIGKVLTGRISFIHSMENTEPKNAGVKTRIEKTSSKRASFDPNNITVKEPSTIPIKIIIEVSTLSK